MGREMWGMAKVIGDEFGNDGLVMQAGGYSIQDRCDDDAAYKVRPRGRGQNPTAYVFPDDSAIVIFDDCWDYRVAGCENACPAEQKRCDCGEV